MIKMLFLTDTEDILDVACLYILSYKGFIKTILNQLRCDKAVLRSIDSMSNSAQQMLIKCTDLWLSILFSLDPFFYSFMI